MRRASVAISQSLPGRVGSASTVRVGSFAMPEATSTPRDTSGTYPWARRLGTESVRRG